MDNPTIEQVAWVFEHIRAHMREGGTFRYLIYDRMGFDTDAYQPLYKAVGMDISNMCNDNLPPRGEGGRLMIKGNKRINKFSCYLFAFSFLSLPIVVIIAGLLAHYNSPNYILLLGLNIIGCTFGLVLKEAVDGGYGN